MCPRPKRPTIPAGSSFFLGSLNQSTSIGGEVFTGSKPASFRTRLPRPSAPDREDGAYLVPAVLRLVADAPDHTVVLEELAHPRPHNEPEIRIALRLPGDELEEACLGHHRDVGKLRLEAAEVHGREGARYGLEGEGAQLGVTHLQQPLGEAELVHDLHDRRVQRITPELAVEVRVRLEQRHVDTRSCQQQRHNGPTGPTADHTTGRAPHTADLWRRLLLDVLLLYGSDRKSVV